MPTTPRGFPYPLPTDPPDGPSAFEDLAVAIDSEFDDTATAIAAIGAAWAAWTPTWNGTTGNGTLAGRWKQLSETTFFEMHLLWGSTTAVPAASAPFAFSLPTAAQSVYHTFPAVAYDLSVLAVAAGTCFLSNTTTFQIGNSVASGLWRSAASAPFNFATGDVLVVAGTYEAA